jgi:CRP/FNR family nitrogen fixation transcriptional regulator
MQISADCQSAPHLCPIVVRGFDDAASRVALQPTRSARRFVKDEQIYAEGDRAGSFYQVVWGAVRTYKLLSDGRRQIDAFHLPGDLFGIESGEEHRFFAEAVGEASVLSFRRRTLEALAGADAELSRRLVMAVMRSLERAQDHMILLGRKSALEKIATFLLDMAARGKNDNSVELPMQRNDIADYLGLTIETVSRSLTQLERESVIALPSNRHVELRNKAALRRLNS